MNLFIDYHFILYRTHLGKTAYTYEQENQKLKSKVNSQIYNQIIPSGVDKKIENLKKYLEK